MCPRFVKRRFGLEKNIGAEAAVWLLVFVLAFVVCAVPARAQQLTNDPTVQASFTGISEIVSAVGEVTQMTFGPDGRLYVATFRAGVRRYDYDPSGNLTNPTIVWSRPHDTANGQFNGSLGIAFHEDPILGTVMYLAPAVSSGFNVTLNRTQSIIRLTNNNDNGTWGEAGEVNQAIVDNLRMTDLHQVNQLLVQGDTLYAGIGSRTRTGGNVSELGGGPNPDDGEFAYTAAINWIRDLTQLSGDTTTPNIAGFNITQHHTDSQPFTSTDTGKLTVYSTGFRNMYGLAFDAEGQLWATMNQNEDPLKPDELHRTDFKDDHKFPKKNEVSGDWKTNTAATAAGFFQTFEEPVALLGNHASANGLDFTYRNLAFAGDAFLVRFSAFDDLLAVDPTTGATTQIATGFSNPIDVLTDPAGNLLVGQHGSGKIFRLSLVDNAGDYNRDGEVDAADYVVWRKTLSQTGANLAADGSGNRVIDNADYAIWRARLGNGAVNGSSTADTAVPEPATAWLWIGLVASIFTQQKRGLTRRRT